MEDYAAKMQLKTEAALREYVTGHAQYQEAAVLAAFDELRRRDRPAPEEAALRPTLEPVVAAQRQAAAAAEAEAARLQASRAPAGGPAADAEETGPFLYSPSSIIFFSIFFSMVAGGVLLGINLGRLRRWGALVGLAIFVVLYQGGKLLLLRSGIHPLLVSLMELPAVLLYLLWFWPRYVATAAYRSRSWLPPLLACLVVAFGMAWVVLQALPGFADKTPEQQQQALHELLMKRK